MTKNTKTFNKNCQFFISAKDTKQQNPSTDNFKFKDFIDTQYYEVSKNEIEIRYVRGSRCSKKIQVKRGEHPLCKEHLSEKYGEYLKKQRKLKKNEFNYKTRTSLYNEEQKELYHEKFFPKKQRNTASTKPITQNSFYFLMLIPGIIVFALVFLFGQGGFWVDTYIATPSVEKVPGTDAYIFDAENQTLKKTGTKYTEWQYPALRKFLIATWLCFPTYYLIIEGGAGKKPISSLIIKALYYLFAGFLFMVAAYFIIGLFGVVLGI
tara:strand:+ start:910 stop:1704 length:795 start_codon:yes stop_codon:yes gene_type:complete